MRTGKDKNFKINWEDFEKVNRTDGQKKTFEVGVLTCSVIVLERFMASYRVSLNKIVICSIWKQ